MTTEPNDPRVTRALEEYYAGCPSLASYPYLRELMARALDAADEPLPVRDVSRGIGPVGSCGISGCLTHPPVFYKSGNDAVSRETVDATGFAHTVLNAWESAVSRETRPNALERLRNWRRRAR